MLASAIIHGSFAPSAFPAASLSDTPFALRTHVHLSGLPHDDSMTSLSHASFPRPQVTLEEAQDTVNLWYAARVEVKNWQKARIEEAKRTGYVPTLLGRRRRLPEINSRNRLLSSHMERAAINTPVQVGMSPKRRPLPCCLSEVLRVSVKQARLRDRGRGGFCYRPMQWFFSESPSLTALFCLELINGVVSESVSSKFTWSRMNGPRWYSQFHILCTCLQQQGERGLVARLWGPVRVPPQENRVASL